MELFKAHNQWASRPPDERFWNLEEMIQATRAYRNMAAVANVNYADLRVEAVDGEIRLLGQNGTPALLTHWAMGQVSGRAGAPASYLRTLPATLAAQNLNHGLKQRGLADPDDQAKALFHRNNGSLLVRALTGVDYGRLWNHELGESLKALSDELGWRVPPAMPSRGDSRSRVATEDDCMPGSFIRPGMTIGPAGVYASNHDMFVFMINPESYVEDRGKPLYRGFFMWNSEVGASSWGIMAFLFNGVCGNHIVWGAQGVFELKIRHSKHCDQRVFQQMAVELRRFSDESNSEFDAKIVAAKRFILEGKTKKDVLEWIFGTARQKKIGIPLKAFDAAYDIAVEREDDYGAPNTMWGMVQGLTQLSQEQGFADGRVSLDREAGKLLEITF